MRRYQTRYLVGFEDLEPIVSDMINNNVITTSKLVDQIKELQKEMAEHKEHIEKTTNSADMSFLAPIKTIIDEQVTAMYSFQNEISKDMKLQKQSFSET